MCFLTIVAQVIGLVYDVTNRASFEAIQEWSKQIDEVGRWLFLLWMANSSVSDASFAQCADTTVCRILIGNKCDCDPRDVAVTENEGRRLADSYNIPFFLTSAKNNVNVNEVRPVIYIPDQGY